MSMTKWYKYSLKEYGVLSNPILKKSFKREEKDSNVNDQNARFVFNSFFVLWFSPNCGLFTCLKVTCSQALAYSKFRAAYSQGFGEKMAMQFFIFFNQCQMPRVFEAKHRKLCSLKSSQLREFI